MNKNAFKVPLLNREGVIPSEQTTIQVPDTIDSSFLTTIKNNPNANFLYEGYYYAYKGTDKNNISFFVSTQVEYYKATRSLALINPLQPVFTFTLPTNYAPNNYSITANKDYILNPNNNVITIAPKEATTFFTATVQSLMPISSTLGLTISFLNETPVIKSYTINTEL